MRTQVDQAIAQAWQLEMQAMVIVGNPDIYYTRMIMAAREAETHAREMRQHYFAVRTMLDQASSK